MEIIGCGKGHYYNPELYSSCPECAKEKGNADVLGATEPVDFGAYANNAGGNIGVTEPVFGNHNGPLTPDPVGWNYGASEIGVTEPVGPSWKSVIPGGSSEPATIPQGKVLGTEFFDDNAIAKTTPIGSQPVSGGSKVEDYGNTMPVDPFNTRGKSMDVGGYPGMGYPGGIPFQPVVGWLVCIDGPAKGRDFRIHSQYNYIGRGQHMDICISGDDCISTDRAAVIAYDAVEKFFSFGPSMGHNVVRVNGKMLMNAVVLNAYDELTIGKTKLLFVPLCGERFNWHE